jgi:hypothetical protein
VTTSPASVLAVIAAGLLLVGVGFQGALAAGAPWAAAAYGGRAVRPNGTLPTRYRVSSAFTVVVLLATGCLVLLRGGVIGTVDPAAGWLSAVMWALAGLFVVNTVGNLAGRHPAERWAWVGSRRRSPRCARSWRRGSESAHLRAGARVRRSARRRS